jgi:hypothetical protein
VHVHVKTWLEYFIVSPQGTDNSTLDMLEEIIGHT